MNSSLGLDLIHSFVVVAEELNFRRSAERLNIDQSALTRRIQKLEHVVQFSLFERTTREVSLTPAGRSFYEENARIVQAYESSVTAAKRIAEGKTCVVRIGYMAFAATDLVPDAVSRFRRAYPYVDVNLRYIRTQGQKLALAHDEIDLGYMIGPFEHTEFHSLLLKSDPLYVVTPRNHRFTRLHDIRPTDLASEDMILGDMMEWEAYRWQLTGMFSSEGVSLKVSLEASNTLALLGLVAAGLGVTVYPESLIGFLGRNVEVRPIIHRDFHIQTILVWKRTNSTKSVGNFIKIAKNLSSHR